MLMRMLAAAGSGRASRGMRGRAAPGVAAGAGRLAAGGRGAGDEAGPDPGRPPGRDRPVRAAARERAGAFGDPPAPAGGRAAARLDEPGTGAAPKEDAEQEAGGAGAAGRGGDGGDARGEARRSRGLPEEDAGREGNAAVVALLESAREAEKARQYGRAAAALERALKVEPRNPWLWNRLAAIAIARAAIPRPRRSPAVR